MTNERHRVVIIGAGFGGLFAARRLRRAPVDVTIVDRTNHHLFQPLLYQVATGVLSEGEIAPPIRDVLRRQGNTRVLMGEVTDIDLERRRHRPRYRAGILTVIGVAVLRRGVAPLHALQVDTGRVDRRIANPPRPTPPDVDDRRRRVGFRLPGSARV